MNIVYNSFDELSTNLANFFQGVSNHMLVFTA